MNFKQFMKNTKAISPIFATLILIAIAVIAGVVVYMFVSGSLGNNDWTEDLQHKRKYTIQAALTSWRTQLTVYAQSPSGTVVIHSALLKDSSGKYNDCLTALILFR